LRQRACCCQLLQLPLHLPLLLQLPCQLLLKWQQGLLLLLSLLLQGCILVRLEKQGVGTTQHLQAECQGHVC
jgi:hypothetical protein